MKRCGRLPAGNQFVPVIGGWFDPWAEAAMAMMEAAIRAREIVKAIEYRFVMASHL
jgi:hypothetical protein